MSVYTDIGTWCEHVSGIEYRTTAPLTFEIGRKWSGLEIEVRRGTYFDCSIPRGLRWAFDPHDPRFLKASAIHDHLLGMRWDRVTAGAIFHDALKADGVGRARRLAMWLAVSLKGWR
ncbi:Protein of unknown function [Roseivivax halotolerans]|uniref:DUF1353 domain-containing protein n=1 Tax=Roseivivax halotolerans TaxID=93684 RepID=A0A1I5W4J6_9RHOB|nr:DUF1353 domain-containing protein [Roseivivax halotolerans]SFQ14537.1 Protein of unknown function [Roseivivax halotolerans]